ncbi:unnamed protein product [Effrenium voratum]|uniref:Uncharacterized protein n=1 Tax=Effrenium voratum TaxID=2562239 RepID=A0AA36ITC6_9DINO|nr:unnamed protein product [Effrenium voratum]CAJ1460716.1 unnamed protein product [Effrenium voratum]
MSHSLVFTYGDKRVMARGSGIEAVRSLKTLEAFFEDAEEKLGLPPGSYDFYDVFGKISTPADLQRALSNAASGECEIKVVEHHQFVRIRGVEAQNTHLTSRVDALELALREAEQRSDMKLQVASEELAKMIKKCESTIYDEVGPAIETVMKKQSESEKDMRALMEKLAQFDLQELRDLSANALQMRDEVQNCINRLNVLDTQWMQDKEELHSIVTGTNQDLKDLQKYIMGKIDVCIEADADIRRDQQILNERMQLIADDLRLLMEEHQRLSNRTLGVVEENEEMRVLLGQVREDNEHLRHDNFQVSTRVLSLEGVASERWEGFAPGILYFRNWHRSAKGEDVQLSADLSVAVGRGFLAATGVVIGNDEGLAVGDGPCRHFGTPGCFSSYYELEVDEVTAAPSGAGGLYVGVSLQSGEEISTHPRREFDGWMVGGNRKAMTVRASCGHEAMDAEKLPDTFAPGADERDVREARKALRLLRAALPPLAKGKAEEVELRDSWSSEGLRMGDRVGVLFRCNREGGALIRVAVNGDIVTTHHFAEAPPAEAVGFLTPVIRLAGTGTVGSSTTLASCAKQPR